MKHGLAGILLLFSTLAGAAEIELLLPAGGGHFAESAPGQYPVKVNLDALQLAPGDEVKLNLSGASHAVVYERSAHHANGDVTWVGYLKEKGNDYRVIITRGASGSFGRILTPDGEFALEPAEGGEKLIDRKRAGHEIMPMGDDIHIPDDIPLSPASPQAAPQNSFAATSSNVDIDLLILYTPGMVTRYPGAALQTRFNYLVSLANQAYIDSKVGINLRLMHSEQVGYSDTTSNLDALNALLSGSDPALSGVATLRAQYGADLVALIRPFNKATSGGNAGIALGIGLDGSDISQYASMAFSVTSDGKDTGGTGAYASDYVLAHELGHNMGCMHDRANAVDYKGAFHAGAFPYSYGYGKEGTFGTVMSYISPRVGKFSNPAITCNGQPCGIAETAPDAANNALSLNNTRFAIANFKPTSGKTPEYTYKPEYTDNGDGTVTHTTTGLTWKRCSEGQTGSDCSGWANAYTWDQAMALGSNGWGLPTLEQLKTLVETGHGSPTINTYFFPNTLKQSYWSSSVYSSDSSRAWGVLFSMGTDFPGGKKYDGYVRLVRGGQTAPAVSLDALSLSCPATLEAGASGTCSATATYSDKSSKAVTPVWSVTGGAASIAATGLLSAGQSPVGATLQVTASYSDLGITRTASATVTIKAADFTINTDGTVLHNKTGLTWKRCSEGQTGADCSGTAKTYTWDQAMALGSNGWGLPTLEQLRTLVETGHGSPTINTTIFPKTPASYFWSASAIAGAGGAGNAWLVSFNTGDEAPNAKVGDLPVRLVRNGQSVGTSPVECLFAWAEKNYPNTLAPAGAATQMLAPYAYRYYGGTKAHLGTSTADNHLYYLGPLSKNAILDLGSADAWLQKAGCK